MLLCGSTERFALRQAQGTLYPELVEGQRLAEVCQLVESFHPCLCVPLSAVPAQAGACRQVSQNSNFQRYRRGKPPVVALCCVVAPNHEGRHGGLPLR